MSAKNQTALQNYANTIKEINKEMTDIQLLVLSIVNNNEPLDSLNEILQKYDILNDKNKFNDFLHLLRAISESRFKVNEIDKINEIIFSFKTKITEMFQQREIFHIFCPYCPILFSLYENQIINFDMFLEYGQYALYRFFLPEYIEHNQLQKIKIYFENEVEQYQNDLEQFRIKRKEYHSDCTISKIIREDDIESFTNYVSRTNLPLDSKIPKSIFEVNSDLLHMVNTLIEYAAVFKSIQIFKYLYNKIEKLPQDILLAAVLGGSSEIIHLIENKGIKPNHFILFRSILANQIDLFDYFISNYSLPLEQDLVNYSVKSFNYFTLSELLLRSPEFLSNINDINAFFSQTCFSDSRQLFNVLLSVPELDVNTQQDIL